MYPTVTYKTSITKTNIELIISYILSKTQLNLASNLMAMKDFELDLTPNHVIVCQGG